MRTALVTGGNRGIGFEVARTLAQQGLRVVIGARSEPEGSAAATAINPDPVRVRALALDLQSGESIQAAVATLRQWEWGPDVLINNAGIYRDGGLLGTAEADLRTSFEVHFFGPVLLCQAFVPDMLLRGYGRIVNLSSGYGSFADGLHGSGAYATSKAALNALTVKVAQEVRGDVKINSVCPGWVRTRMGGDHADRSPAEGADTVVWLATLPDSGPCGGFFRDRKRIAW